MDFLFEFAVKSEEVQTVFQFLTRVGIPPDGVNSNTNTFSYKSYADCLMAIQLLQSLWWRFAHNTLCLFLSFQRSPDSAPKNITFPPYDVVHLVDSFGVENCLRKLIGENNFQLLMLKRYDRIPPFYIGMDTEWNPEFQKGQKNPIALIQLSNGGYTCIIRTHEHRSAIPPCLQNLLECDRIWKVGLQILHSDKPKIQETFGIDLRGVCEISKFSCYRQMREKKSLALLAESLLDVKHPQLKVAKMKWTARHLAPDHIQYAAEDACLSFFIFQELLKLEIQYSTIVATVEKYIVTSQVEREKNLFELINKHKLNSIERLKLNFSFSLNILELFEMNLTDKEAFEISESLKSHTTLELLNLSRNKIQDTGAIAIAESLIMNHNLKALLFQENHSLSEKTALAFLSVLKNFNKTLKSLNLQQTGIPDPVLVELRLQLRENSKTRQCAVLKNCSNKQLSSFLLEHANLEDFDIKELIPDLLTHPELTSLVFSGCNISDDSTQILVDSLFSLPNLTELTFKRNRKVSELSEKVLSGIVRNHPSLVSLNMEGSSIPSQCVERLRMQLQMKRRRMPPSPKPQSPLSPQPLEEVKSESEQENSTEVLPDNFLAAKNLKVTVPRSLPLPKNIEIGVHCLAIHTDETHIDVCNMLSPAEYFESSKELKKIGISNHHTPAYYLSEIGHMKLRRLCSMLTHLESQNQKTSTYLPLSLLQQQIDRHTLKVILDAFVYQFEKNDQKNVNNNINNNQNNQINNNNNQNNNQINNNNNQNNNNNNNSNETKNTAVSHFSSSIVQKTQLILSSCIISEEIACELINGLKTSKIASLTIIKTQLTEKVGIELVNLMHELDTLRQITLEATGLSLEITDHIEKLNVRKGELGFTGNRVVKQKQPKYVRNEFAFKPQNADPHQTRRVNMKYQILEAVRNKQCFKSDSLDLSNYHLSHQELQDLASSIETDITLKGLLLSNNQIKDESVLVLCQALKKNNMLKTLLLNNNPEISDRSGRLLLEVFKQSASLAVINVNETGISLDLQSQFEAEKRRRKEQRYRGPKYKEAKAEAAQRSDTIFREKLIKQQERFQVVHPPESRESKNPPRRKFNSENARRRARQHPDPNNAPNETREASPSTHRHKKSHLVLRSEPLSSSRSSSSSLSSPPSSSSLSSPPSSSSLSSPPSSSSLSSPPSSSSLSSSLSPLPPSSSATPFPRFVNQNSLRSSERKDKKPNKNYTRSANFNSNETRSQNSNDDNATPRRKYPQAFSLKKN